MQPMAHMALRAARRAIPVLLQGMDRLDRLKVEQKAPNDFVSEVDRESERVIVDVLRAAYPTHRFLGEEHGVSGPEDAEFTWIVDPLDGTLNYLLGIPHFAISIAARKGRRIEHGVIVDPVRNEEWVASRGAGAQLNGKRIRVSPVRRLDEAVLATGLPPKAKQQPLRVAAYNRAHAALLMACRNLRRQGSAALDLAYTASARVDGFFQMSLAPWDIAAGILLVQEAGGFIGDFSGGEGYFESGDTVAANPSCFKLLVTELRKALDPGQAMQAAPDQG